MLYRSRYTLLFLWVAGLAAGLLRAFELKIAWDTDLMLMGDTSPYAALLTGFVLLVVLAAFLLSRRAGEAGTCEVSASLAPRRFPIAFSVCGYFSVLMLALSGLFDLYEAIQTAAWEMLIFALFTFLAVVAAWMILRGVLTLRRDAHSLYLLALVFWGTFWLILAFRETPTLPVTTLYIYDTMSIAFFMLAVLSEAGRYFDRAHPRRALFFASVGLFFSLISLVSQGLYFVTEGRWIDVTPTLGHGLRMVFLALSLSAMICDLIGRNPASRTPKNNADTDGTLDPVDNTGSADALDAVSPDEED